MTKRICEKCGKRDAIVGLGPKPSWICLECFDKAMAHIGKGIRAMVGDAKPEVTVSLGVKQD